MHSLRVRLLSTGRSTKTQLLRAVTATLLPLFLLGLADPADANWRGGHLTCAKTKIADASHLTITEGAAILGLNVLASVLPAEVAELLDTSEGITLFAPTDEAFGNVPADILDAIASDEEVLTTVLAYHISPNEVDPRRAFFIRKADTLAGQPVFLNRSRSGPMVNQSEVECQGYRTANGMVWLIDSVLLPQF